MYLPSTPSSIMDNLFQQSLTDLIKSLRLTTPPSRQTLSSQLSQELSSTDPHTQSLALLKHTYLRSLYPHLITPLSSAPFAAVSLLSSHVYYIKQIGYLSGCLTFAPDMSLILLLPNTLRKDLVSNNPHEVSLALNLISCVPSLDLARDLLPEIFNLLGTNKLFVRKKVIGALVTVFRVYSDGIRVCFKRMVENLENADMSVVSVTVSVFCEMVMMGDAKTYLPLAPEFYKILVDSRNNWVLIKKHHNKSICMVMMGDAKTYFPLEPEFYKILVDSNNNWVLIKVLKIFAKLAPLEPRLAKRVVEPICDIMRRTGAKSLVFECIRTVFEGLVEYESAVRLAVEKVKEFVMDEDPNLKYLGLKALAMLTPIHSWAVMEYKDVVVRSLSDTDPNVKIEALGLVMSMVSEDNVVEICRVLLHYALKSDPIFCNEILGSILMTCNANFYEIIVDFDWYVTLLGEMSRVPHCQKGEEIETQMIDIGIRVRDVRPELVRVSRELVIDPALLGNPFLHRILSAAAWVSGEYVEFSKNPIEVAEALLQPRTDLLPPLIRAIYIQSVFKVLVFCLNSYFFPNEAVSSFLRANGLDPLVEDSVRDCQNNSDSGIANEDFNPRILSQTVEGICEENPSDTIVTPGPSSSSFSLENGPFTHESIVHLFRILKTALSLLLDNHEVEILERVRNVLGLVELVEQEMCDSSVEKKEKIVPEDLNVSEIVRLMRDVFSEELGLVSAIAQERVPIPDGLVLMEDLKELEIICADLELPTSSSFSLVKPRFEENTVVSSISYGNEDPSEPTSESTSLLTEHRKRHGLYYLPSDVKETSTYEYPPAQETNQSTSTSGEVDELVKLTEQSFVIKKKTNKAKPRPVVVKLEEGDDIRVAVKKHDSKESSITGVLRDVLGDEANSFDKSSSIKNRGKGKANVGHDVETAGKSADEVDNFIRKSKHRSHGKMRKHNSSSNNMEDKEQKSEKDKKRSHTKGKNKDRQRADVVPRTSVIPDFLL